MGQHVSRTDFEWTDDDQQNNLRRAAILKKYPEIKQLFGHDPNLKWICTAMVFTQIASLYFLQDKSWPVLIIVGYCFGGVINHSLIMAIHDISHNTCFGNSRYLANRVFGMFVNLTIGVPMSISFKRYHTDHHRYLGFEVLDSSMPTSFEAKIFCTTFRKFCWVFLQPIIAIIRPIIVNPKPPVKLEIVNLVIQVIFDAIIVYSFGWKMLAYLFFGTISTLGLHPLAGQILSEHYMFKKGYETYSYYGPLNWITFNVGYHNEHHDFPSVPGSRLPLVKKIAAEFYDDLPQHHSWTKVIYDFIFDTNLGLYAQIKRKPKVL